MKRSTQYIIIGAVAFVVVLGALLMISNNQTNPAQIIPTAEVATLATPTPELIVRSSDADGDGVPDDSDVCANTPAGTTVDATGCEAKADPQQQPTPEQQMPPTQEIAPLPPMDSDGDGVMDDVDQCPSEAGLVELNGCPQQAPPPDPLQPTAEQQAQPTSEQQQAQPTAEQQQVQPTQVDMGDNDGDTVPNYLDRCPNTGAGRQVYGGDSQQTGCDLPDSDGDGVQDVRDTCPNEAGTEANGCPAAPVATNEPTATATDAPEATATYTNTPGQQAQNPAEKTLSFVANVSGSIVNFDATASEAATYAWTFGSAQAVPASSTDEDPTVNYPTTGTYSVTLSATFGDGTTLSVTQNVTIAAPQVTAACEVTGAAQNTATPGTYLVNFAATGTGIASYTWDFGNGTSGTGANAQATYSGPASYNYTLTCAPTGGGANIVLNGSVTVTETRTTGPVINAAFTANSSIGVNGTLILTNTSTVSPAGTTLTYVWTVTGPAGYNQTSTATSPRFTLAGVGQYNITLVVSTGVYNATATGSVTVVQATAEPKITISANPRSGASPLTVSFSAVNTGGPITSYEWNLGNGDSASTETTSATYTEAGRTYTITVKAVGPGGESVATTTVAVLAEADTTVARFSATQTAINGNLATFCFQNLTEGAYDSATWNFGAGFDLVTTSDAQICRDFPAGTRVIELVIAKPGNITSTSQQQITPAFSLTPPTVRITNGDTNVTVGQTVQFSAETTGAIRTYAWDFGAFGSSSEANPRITFNQEGTFTANLTVTGPGGSAQSAAVTINVGYRTIACTMDGDTTASLGATKTYRLNVTNLQGRAVTYQWTINSTAAGTAASQSVSFPTAGTTTVVGEAFVNGNSVCRIERAVTLNLQALNCTINGTSGPLVGASPTYTLNVSNDNLNGRTITDYTWSLKTEDGTTVQSGTSQNFNYTFAEPGVKYNLTLDAVANNGDICSANTAITTATSALDCSISGNGSYDVYQTRSYTANVNGGSGAISYEWFLNGQSTGVTTKTFSKTFPDTTASTLSVNITRGNATCSPTKGLTPGSTNTTLTCSVGSIGTIMPGQNAGLSVNVNNLRGRTATYAWTVDGDATYSATTRNAGYSTATAGTYTARYRVTTSPGNDICEGTATWTVSSELATCRADFDSTINPYQSSSASVNVTSFVAQNPDIAWTINGQPAGNGRTVTYPAALINVPNSSFTVAYTVGKDNTTLCTGEFVVSTRGGDLTCNISVPSNVYVGEAANFRVNVNNANGRSINYTWYVNGDQVQDGASDRLNTTYTGDASTPLVIRVVGTPTVGNACDVSANVNARANQSISATANPGSGLVGTRFDFTAVTDNMDRGTLVWTYPDGSTERAETGSYIFDTPGTYTISVTGRGPIRTQTAEVVVQVVDRTALIASFTANPGQAIAPSRICFTDTSTTTGAAITSWSWSSGNGQTSSDQNPCFDYSETGDYDVTLNVDNGVLQGRASNRVRLLALTDGSISIGTEVNDAGEICFTANRSDGISVSGWDFGDGQSAGGQDRVCHTYTDDGTFNVVLTFAKGNLTGSVNTSVSVDTAASVALPVLRASGSCDVNNVGRFRIVNIGGNMTSEGSADVNGTVSGDLGSQRFTLASGEDYTFTVNGAAGETITVSGGGLNASANVKCPEPKPPQLSVDGQCVYGDRLSVRFVISNTGGTIYTDTATVSFPVAAGQSQTSSSVTVGINQSVAVTQSGGEGDFSISLPNVGGAVTSTKNCLIPDTLTATGVCWVDAGSYTFEVYNPGSRDVTVVYGAGSSATVPAGQTVTLTVSGTYPDAVTFNGTFGDNKSLSAVGDDRSCEGSQPDLGLSAECSATGTVTFNLSNDGSLPILDGTFTAYSYPNGGDANSAIELEQSDLTLDAQALLNFSYSGQEGRTMYATFSSSNERYYSEVSVSCDEPVAATPVGPQATPVPSKTPSPDATPTAETPGAGLCGEVTSSDGFPAVNMDQSNCAEGTEQALTNWSPVEPGAAMCPTWILYHTNRTENWEIFRLGDFPQGKGFNLDADPNVSKGAGANIVNLGPSRSPDAKWVVFSSNRDGDLELYLTPVDGTLADQVQLTINDGAIDFDPMWSPDGRYIAYETTVYNGGNFELGLIDLLTGEKRNLTMNPATDFNAAWSPDSSKILFQSNRTATDQWDLYEMDVTDLDNITVRQVSPDLDGVDFQDALYAPDGQTLVARAESLVDGKLQSLIVIMDVATGDITYVTEAGTGLNASFSADGNYIAYQDNGADNTSDIYAYEVATATTRLVTSNADQARGSLNASPTWLCYTTTLVFSSDAGGDNELYSTNMLPMDAPAIDVLTAASNLTNDSANDRSPQNTPAEENSSRNGVAPKKIVRD